MISTYALSLQAIRTQALRVLLRFQFVAVFSFLMFGLFLAVGPQPINWWLAGGILVVIAAAYFSLIIYNYRQIVRILHSVRVELDPSYITYRQVRQEPIRISRADVTEVVERPDGLLVQTVNPRIQMLVPTGLADGGYAHVHAALAEWLPINRSMLAQRRVNGLMFWFSVMGGLVIIWFANSLWVSVPVGVFLFSFGSYAERRLNYTYAVDWRITRSYSIAFSFLICVIMAKACLLVLLSFK